MERSYECALVPLDQYSYLIGIQDDFMDAVDTALNARIHFWDEKAADNYQPTRDKLRALREKYRDIFIFKDLYDKLVKDGYVKDTENHWSKELGDYAFHIYIEGNGTITTSIEGVTEEYMIDDFLKVNLP